MAGWLLLLAALLWPIDCALRRLNFTGAPLTAAAGHVADRIGAKVRRPPVRVPRPGRRPASPGPEPGTEPARVPEASATLGRLLERKRRSGGDGGRGGD